jgi:hypothetical protein
VINNFFTEDNIFVLHTLIYKSFINKQRLYCGMIDFRRAFNSIYRNGLWYKAVQYGMNGKLLRVVRDMYDQIKCCVRCKQGVTDFFLTLQGLQQGAILSPYLFAFYVNDLPTVMQSGNPEGGVKIGDINIVLLMYADDLVIVSNTAAGLQESLDILHDYCNRWKLTVNHTKSQILVCKQSGPRLQDEVWFYGDQMLVECEGYSYLGITFTARGITNISLNVLTGQAKKALSGLCYNMKQIGVFPPSIALMCFHTCITPILCYGSSVWGYMPPSQIQTLLNRY